MNLKNLKIGTQLILAYTVILVMMIGLGIMAFVQTSRIQSQSEMLYNHPLQVRTALGALENDILRIQLSTLKLKLAATGQEKQNELQMIGMSSADILFQFKVFRERYLGPASDVDSVNFAYLHWQVNETEKIRLILSGKSANNNTPIYLNKSADELLALLKARINVIDKFAVKKSHSLYQTSVELKSSLNYQLIVVLAVMSLVLILISFLIIRNIQKPILVLTEAANQFNNGNLNARSVYKSQNEFGKFSDSFNNLASRIQENMQLNEKVLGLSALMMSEYDAKKFFQATLNALAENTGAQMAAVYLLDEDKKNFKHFASAGVNELARQSFDAAGLEGEFGSALASQKIQHIKNIPEDSQFEFLTVNGKFTPREIITIPVLVDRVVVAVVSLASLHPFSSQAVLLINTVLSTLSARIEGILVYQKIKEFSLKLEIQNNELEIQKKQLDKANQLKTNFLSNMSHELRTPLNSVIALSGVLSRRIEKLIPAEEYSYLEVIERNGKHLLRLINDILDISRIEAGREEIEITSFNIHAMVADVINMIRPIAEQKGLKLIQNDSDSDLFINSDSDKCHHILQNLLSNSVKFTEKGAIVLTAFQSIDNVVITVTDSGIGISEDHLPHIFDEFRQADGSTSRKYGGTGLGLAIAQKFATLLGGTLSASSTYGKGSVFTLILPKLYIPNTKESSAKSSVVTSIASEPGLSVTLTAPAEKITNTTREFRHIEGKPLVLVVEDNPDNMITVKAIRAGNFQVFEAVNGDEAILKARQYMPDIILMDIALPGMDGIDAFYAIRNDARLQHIPVIALTASTMVSDRETILVFGLDAYIAKPIDEKEFFKTINSILYGT
jgi:signal transduction histidine kinase